MSKRLKKDKKTVIPITTVKEYVMQYFKGKAGWKYISIARPNSTFTKEFSQIVDILLHKDIPVLTSSGKYTSEGAMLIKCIKLLPNFKDFDGFVIKNTGEFYSGNNLDNERQGVTNILNIPTNDSYLKLNPEEFLSEVDADLVEKASVSYMQDLTEMITDTNNKFNTLNKFFKDAKGEALDSKVAEQFKQLEQTLDNSKNDTPEEMEKNFKLIKELSGTFGAVLKEAESVKTMAELIPTETKEIEQTLKSDTQLPSESVV